jgi:hypothetical protein
VCSRAFDTALRLTYEDLSQLQGATVRVKGILVEELFVKSWCAGLAYPRCSGGRVPKDLPNRDRPKPACFESEAAHICAWNGSAKWWACPGYWRVIRFRATSRPSESRHINK